MYLQAQEECYNEKDGFIIVSSENLGSNRVRGVNLYMLSTTGD